MKLKTLIKYAKRPLLKYSSFKFGYSSKSGLKEYVSKIKSNPDFFEEQENITNYYRSPLDIITLLEDNILGDLVTFDESIELLISNSIYNVVDIRLLHRLLKIMINNREFANFNQINQVLSKILKNYELNSSFIHNEQFICSLIETLKDIEIFVKNKSTFEKVFSELVLKLITVENLPLIKDRYLVFSLFLLNSLNVEVPKRLKFIIEVSISQDNLITKFIRFGKDIVYNKNTNNIVKNFFLNISTFDNSIIPINVKILEEDIPTLIIALSRDLKKERNTQKYKYLIKISEIYLRILEKDLEIIEDLNNKRIGESIKIKDSLKIHERIEIIGVFINFIDDKVNNPVVKLLIDVNLAFMREYAEYLNLNHIIKLFYIMTNQQFIVNYDISIIVPGLKDSLLSVLNKSKYDLFVISELNYLLLMFSKLNYFDLELIEFITKKILSSCNQNETVNFLSFLMNILIITKITTEEVNTFLRNIKESFSLIEKTFALIDHDLFSENIKIILIYLKYYYIYERSNIISSINYSFLNWLTTNNQSLRDFFSEIDLTHCNIKNIRKEKLLDIIRIFNIILMIDLLEIDFIQHEKIMWINDYSKNHYKSLVAYFMNENNENDIITDDFFKQTLNRNFYLFIYLMKRNEYDLSEFKNSTQQNMDIYYLIHKI